MIMNPCAYEGPTIGVYFTYFLCLKVPYLLKAVQYNLVTKLHQVFVGSSGQLNHFCLRIMPFVMYPENNLKGMRELTRFITLHPCFHFLSFFICLVSSSNELFISSFFILFTFNLKHGTG